MLTEMTPSVVLGDEKPGLEYYRERLSKWLAKESPDKPRSLSDFYTLTGEFLERYYTELTKNINPEAIAYLNKQRRLVDQYFEDQSILEH